MSRFVESAMQGLSTRGEIPILDLLFESVLSAPGALMRGANSILEGAGELAGSAIGAVKNGASSVGSTLSEGRGGQTVSQKVGRSAALHMGQVEEPPLGRDGVSMREIGQMNAQFNGQASVRQTDQAVVGL